MSLRRRNALPATQNPSLRRRNTHALLARLLPRSGFHLEITAGDLDGMHRRLREAGIEPQGKPRVRPWGERTFGVKDPDGYLLEFQEG